jgi:hypothetical protein
MQPCCGKASLLEVIIKNPSMKKYSSILVIAFMLIAAVATAQNRETRSVGAFSKIAFKVPGKLILRQGATQKVEVEAKKDIIQQIETTVEGSKLVIGKEGKWKDWNWSSDNQITVYVTITDLQALAVSGSGTLEGDGKFKAGNLDLDVSGSGSLIIDVDASGDISADVSGSGDITLKGSCNSFDSDVSGSGKVDATLQAKGVAAFEVSGSGRISAKGSADLAKASISGSGKVLAADLEVNRCDVSITGSGDVEINVKKELDARITGSGTVSYKGNPDKVNANASGSGKVSKM